MQMSDLLEKSGLRDSFNDPRIWMSEDSENVLALSESLENGKRTEHRELGGKLTLGAEEETIQENQKGPPEECGVMETGYRDFQQERGDCIKCCHKTTETED